MDKENLIEKRQETKNEKNYFSKILAYMISIIITLIVCFMIIIISGNISGIIFFISIYTLLSSIIMKNISCETEFGQNITKAMININKIVIIIICITASLKIFTIGYDEYVGKYSKNYVNIDIFDIIGYTYILANILYFCTQKKDYFFSLVNAIVTIIFLNNTCLYLIKENILDDTKYVIIMFLAIACICVLYNFVVKYIFKNEKWKGIKLASNFINVIFIPILIIASVIQISSNNKLEIESVIYLLIIIIILIQKIIYLKSVKKVKNQLKQK